MAWSSALRLCALATISALAAATENVTQGCAAEAGDSCSAVAATGLLQRGSSVEVVEGDGRRRRDRRRATTTVAPTYTEKTYSYSFSRKDKMYDKNDFKVKLLIDFSLSFTVNKGNTCAIGFSSTGKVTVKAVWKDWTGTNWKADVDVLKGPTWDVNTESITAEQCENHQCLSFRFINLGGCTFNKWQVRAKVVSTFNGNSVSTGWKTVMGELVLF
jgi:hypothetical protein